MEFTKLMLEFLSPLVLDWFDRILLIGIAIACIYEAGTVWVDRSNKPIVTQKKTKKKRIMYTDINTGKKRVRYV